MFQALTLLIMRRILINVLYVNKQEFSASSWRSNQGLTKNVYFIIPKYVKVKIPKTSTESNYPQKDA
jgi:hypothetical protein